MSITNRRDNGIAAKRPLATAAVGTDETTIARQVATIEMCVIYLRERRRYMRLPAMFVCLSVCLLARLLKDACMDLDESFCVGRCRDMDELINF